MDNQKAPEKKKSFFNLFDVVIIGIVLLAAVVFLLWQHGSGTSIVTNTESKTVQYTIELSGM